MIYQYIPHAADAMFECMSESFQKWRPENSAFIVLTHMRMHLTCTGVDLWTIVVRQGDNVCLCVAVSGGVASYSAPDGSEPEQGLTDSSYDGQRTEDGLLVAGLGRLTDGEFGADNFRLDTGYGKGM